MSEKEGSRSSKEGKHERERKSKKAKKKSKGEWVELPNALPVTKPKREDWMTVPVLSKPLTKEPGPRKVEKTTHELGQHPKELNPYWKNGGSGLPIIDDVKDSNPSKVEGHAWLLRSYQNTLHQSCGSSIRFKELAKEHGGSLENSHSLLKSAGIDPEYDFQLAEKEPILNSSNFTSENVHTSDVTVTEGMINHASSKLIKAELMGNKEKAQRLRLELESLKSEHSESCESNSEHSSQIQKKPILLASTDRFGHTRPMTKKRKTDDLGLDSLVKMEHMLTAEDTHKAISKMASKFVRSSSNDIIDDVVDSKIKIDSEKEDKRQKLIALTQSKKMAEILDNCKFCINTLHFKQHLIVAMGINAYLSVPSYQSLTACHCLIIPIEHTTCVMNMDENVYSEVKIFQKGLTKMFSDNNMDVIFTECYNTLRKSHACIDCIPITKEEGSVAPMYFKKAILESDTEWSDNRKLIDTRKNNLRKSLPRGLPYFFVDFNNEGGFAHVIEDSHLFPHYFGKEVIGGLTKAEPQLWLKPKYLTLEDQKSKALKLSQMWKLYDWTNTL